MSIKTEGEGACGPQRNYGQDPRTRLISQDRNQFIFLQKVGFSNCVYKKMSQ